jgi:HSP20 family protein
MNTVQPTTSNEQKVNRETQRKVEYKRPTVAPAVDIYENADGVLLIADLPGVSKENLSIDLEKDRLTLTAKRTQRFTEGPGTKFADFDYFRAFWVPKDIDAEKITAELSNGVLHLHLPRVAAAKPRKIEVKTSS